MATRPTPVNSESGLVGLTIGGIAIGALVLVVLDFAFVGFLGF